MTPSEPDPLALATARVQAEEAKAAQAKQAAAALIRAVWSADPARLPDGVRVARERFVRMVEGEETAPLA